MLGFTLPISIPIPFSLVWLAFLIAKLGYYLPQLVFTLRCFPRQPSFTAHRSAYSQHVSGLSWSLKAPRPGHKRCLFIPSILNQVNRVAVVTHCLVESILRLWNPGLLGCWHLYCSYVNKAICVFSDNRSNTMTHQGIKEKEV